MLVGVDATVLYRSDSRRITAMIATAGLATAAIWIMRRVLVNRH
jgi:hypothetical protein